MLKHWEFKFGERANPQFPDFRKMLLGADHNCVINKREDMDFERGKMGDGADFEAEVINGVLEEKAEENCRKAFPWNMPSTTSKDSKSMYPTGI